jgi:DNA mismatch endonuclease, patch repair protein
VREGAQTGRWPQQRTRDTGPEARLRKELHRRGLRYRLHAEVVPGTRRRVDIVFPRTRIAVDVRGCFWHGCEKQGRRNFSANEDYWTNKRRQVGVRDEDTRTRLEAEGWAFLVVWEHERVEVTASRVERVVRRREAQMLNP